MKYTAPPGSTDPNASYVTGNAVTKVKGSPVPAEAVEHPQREIVNAITAAGLTPSESDLTQLKKAIIALIAANSQTPLRTCSTAGSTAAKTVDAMGFVLYEGVDVRVKFANFNSAADPTLNVNNTGAKAIYVYGYPVQLGDLVAGQIYRMVYDGTVWQVVDGLAPYKLLETYSYMLAAGHPGFVEAAGGLIANADTLYPAAWAYLQTTEGQTRCVTEAQWQALSTAIYYTNAEGVDEGWNGVGGVTKFVIDTEAKTIRVPDLRGMYMEAAGLDGLDVGGVHSDMIRDITGSFAGLNSAFTGAFNLSSKPGRWGGDGQYTASYSFSASRVIPTGNQTKPRAYGTIACIYLGA